MEKIMKKTLLIGLILLSQGLMASTAPTSKPKMQSQELSFLSLNPKYAIEITNLPQIIGSWAFTALCIDAPLGAPQIRCKHP
jgi:hypothetical protein